MVDLERQRLGSLDVARWLAAAVVVLFHAGMFVGDPALKKLLAFGYRGVDFFFVLSGFVIYRAHAADLGRPSRLAEYVRKRFLRIFPPYWVALGLALAAALLFGSHLELTWPNVLSSVLLLPRSALDYPFVVPAWTLHYELVFYAFFGLCIAAPRRLAVLAMVLVPLVILAAWIAKLQPFERADFAAYNALMFFLGIASAALSRRMGPVVAAACLSGGLALLVGMSGNWIRTVYFGVIGYGPAAALTIAGAAALEMRTRSIRSKLTDLFGDLCYGTYLIHYPLFSVLLATGMRTKLSTGSVVLDCAIWTMLGLLGGCVFHFLCERPISAVFRAALRQRDRISAGALTSPA